MKEFKNQAVAYAQVKRDGHQLIVTKIDGVVQALSRNGTDLTEKIKSFGWASSLWSMPDGSKVIGELFVKGRPASAVKTALNGLVGPLLFEVFEVSSLKADASLEEVEQWCFKNKLTFVKFLTIPGIPYDWMFCPEHLEEDQEGWVFKNGNGWEAYKWKPVRTLDLKCVGYVDGNGKNIGLVGSIIGATCDGVVRANAGGISDSERIEVSFNKHEYLGRIFEVAYQYIGAGGRLRHPRFIRWRDDKDTADAMPET